MTAQPTSTTNLLLTAVEVLAIAIIFTSFMTWIRFDSSEMIDGVEHSSSVKVSGDDLSGATDLGDGVVTSIAGALGAAFAIATRFTPGSRTILAAGIAVAGLTACGVATYDTFKDWVSGTGMIIAVEVDVTLYAAMMITALLGLAQGLAGLALFVAAQRDERQWQIAEEEGLEEDEPYPRDDQ
ncbi:MAG TPA: hypothetical protein VFP63_00850 [Dehalococcoidia bacterium]|nr:hypothetical protein [Dehalococcoidia bacterium]